MPELIRDLKALTRIWREYIEQNPATRDDLVFSRAAGYVAGLELCAGQLENIIRKAADND